MQLTFLDLIVIAAPLALIFAVNLYARRFVRGVADFLAASRCAGRFLIASAGAESGSGIILLISAMEVFSQTGFSLRYWDSFIQLVLVFMGLFGLIGYRFRETRALTFHQFFEVRYSKGVRVYASFVNILSGLFNFGIQPAVGARFFVYFCGFPVTLTFGAWHVPTFLVVMLALMAMSLWFALSGGQISVMITDCLEGVLSSFFYLVIAAFVLLTVAVGQMRTSLLSGPRGESYVDPFDIGHRPGLGFGYMVLTLALNLYYFRGNAWTQGNAAAARNAHEGRMAMVLGNWRMYAYTAMGLLVSIAAFTVLHDGAFAGMRQTVLQRVGQVETTQLQTQMLMPIALGVLLVPGIKGCFCAVLLFGLLSAQSNQLLGFGSTLLQDVVLPCLRRPLEPAEHLRWLRLTVLGVGVFACIFSAVFKPVEYLVMILSLIGSIYLGGVGLVVWGGLYWRRGTTAGAWTSLVIGSVLGLLFNLAVQFWSATDRLLTALLPLAPIRSYLARHADHCPLDGIQLSALVAACAGTAYIVVSLATCRRPFNLDALLHRGEYRVADDDLPPKEIPSALSWWDRLLGMDRHFTRSDRLLLGFTAVWTVALNLLAVAVLVRVLSVGPLSAGWWFGYSMAVFVWVALFFGVLTTVWFAFGVTTDLRSLFAMLRRTKPLDREDDGTVRATLPPAAERAAPSLV